MLLAHYYVNSRKQNSWRYTCRPSPYLFYLLNLLSHGRQGWTKGSDPDASCPSRKGHFRSRPAYPQLSRVIQHNILLIFIIMIKELLCATRTSPLSYSLCHQKVNCSMSLLVFPAFSYSAPPVNKCSGFFPTGASIAETTIYEYVFWANRLSTFFILLVVSTF